MKDSDVAFDEDSAPSVRIAAINRLLKHRAHLVGGNDRERDHNRFMCERLESLREHLDRQL